MFMYQQVYVVIQRSSSRLEVQKTKTGTFQTLDSCMAVRINGCSHNAVNLVLNIEHQHQSATSKLTKLSVPSTSSTYYYYYYIRSMAFFLGQPG